MAGLSSILDAKLTYLYSRKGANIIKYELGTTRAIMRELGVEPEKLPCVHVAGTSGKGSVSAMVESVLREAGVKTGLYTSPHLIRFNERIRVGGQMIPDEQLNQLLDEAEVADRAQAEAEGARLGTFFELTTAMAFAYFMQEKVELAVVETGLGGRLDSTNVVMPLVSIITDIGLEHTAILGATLEEVAAEKGGIIKPGRPVVIGAQPPKVEAVLLKLAHAAGSEIIRPQERISIRRLETTPTGQRLSVETPDGGWRPFTLPLLGDFQLNNVSLAISALEWLRDAYALPLEPDVICRGLEKTRWPGRCQIVSQDPMVVVDVGHNPHEAAALAGFLKKMRDGRPVLLISGLLDDKDALGFFRALQPQVADCILVPINSDRNMAPAKLMLAAREAGLHTRKASLYQALESGRQWAKENNGIVVVAGSLFLGAEALYAMGVDIL